MAHAEATSPSRHKRDYVIWTLAVALLVFLA